METKPEATERDLVWLEINMPEATNSDKQRFLSNVENLMKDGGLPEMEARKRALKKIRSVI